VPFEGTTGRLIPSGEGTDWWNQDKKTAHESMFRAVEFLDQTQSYHRAVTNLYLRFYSNRLSDGLSGGEFLLQDTGDILKLNIIKAVVDAATAHIAANRPRPQFLTFGGRKSLREKAKNLGKFVSGQFYKNDTYSLGLEVFRDAALFGTGYMHVYERNGDIAMERVFPDEIIVDQNEARYAMPRQLFRHKEITRHRAAGLWPSHREDIEHARLIRDEQNIADTIVDPVSVVEGWHLPSHPEAKDGRHLIATSNATLVDEKYEWDSFPFGTFRWSKAPLGWEGIGLAEELASIQNEINYLLQKAQRILNLASYQIWLKKGDGIPGSKMQNTDMGFGTFKSQPPVHLPINTGLGEIDNKIAFLWDKAFQQAGISQLQAQGSIPAGLKSGEAIMRYSDETSQRFRHTAQEWERFYMDLSSLTLRQAEQVRDRGDGDIRVLVQDDKELQEILFDDVAIEESDYTMRVFPTNLLPDTPAGKLESIQNLAQVWPDIQPHIPELLDVPDLESIKSRLRAPFDLVDLQIEGILERGENHEPYPQADLEYALTTANLAVLQAAKDSLHESTPEDEANIEKLRVYATRAANLLNPQPEQQEPPMPPPPPEGAMPPGGGGEPPLPAPPEGQGLLPPLEGPLQ